MRQQEAAACGTAARLSGGVPAHCHACWAAQAFEAAIAAKKEAAAAAKAEGGGGGLPPGLKVEDASALAQPGSRGGQQKFVREGGAVVVYAWDSDK